MRRLRILILFFGLAPSVFASNLQWQKAQFGLAHFNTALDQAKSKIDFPENMSNKKRAAASFVAFPQWIPTIQGKAYAHFIVLQDKRRYAIEAASDPVCDLRKTCLLGSLSLEWGGNPTIYYDRENREKTKRLLLHRGVFGYYTPGFAMADFWPARLEWRYHEVLYTLTWQSVENQGAFVRMANSILDQVNSK